MEKIKKIIIGTLDGVWQEATIVDEKNNVNLIKDKNDIINLLSQFAIESSSEITALLNDKEKVVKVEMNSEEYTNIMQSLVKEDENEQIEETEDVVNPSEENPKKKKGKIKFRYIAAGALLISLLAGGIAVVHYTVDEVKKRSAKNNKSYTQTYNNSYTVSSDNSSIGVYTEEEINNLINNINMESALRVMEIEDILNGQRIDSSYSQMHESHFNVGTSEYVAVEEFNMQGRNIVNNKNAKYEDAKNFMDYLNGFIFDIEPIRGTNIYFKDLDQLAKYKIFALGKSLLTILDQNYNVQFYNVDYNKEQLIDLYEAWTGQSYEIILNNYATKRR